LTVLVRTLEFVKRRPILGSDAAMQKQLISRALAAGHPEICGPRFTASARRRIVAGPVANAAMGNQV
jgi:hypothetical protein